jgi:hypothetical protein
VLGQRARIGRSKRSPAAAAVGEARGADRDHLGKCAGTGDERRESNRAEGTNATAPAIVANARGGDERCGRTGEVIRRIAAEGVDIGRRVV